MSTIAPIASPATGVMLYNTNTNINTDIAKGVTYWGSDNSYHSEASYSATEAIISSSNIPLLVFSAAIGQKPNVPVGYTAGGPFTNLSLTGPEILFDKYAAWNPAGNQYKIPASGVYMVEYISEMSNAANMGGTPSLRISNSTTNTNIITGYGRFIPLANRMYTTLIITQNLLSTDVLIFKYIYTDNNYRMEKGTLNIYKY
ncbi:hypothetical protein [Chryseobacterium soldanellicola]|uniref:hypothetical protein n=1 Tax=Chryseobacterium soldanellicola TaxID=311333 RepID=UPI0011136DF4|nr:hypothetical protein [Chryseobacterium soldanellicola]